MQESFRVAVKNLSHHKARTALTLMGVIIGIAAVVALISMGAGLTASISQSIEQLGANNIFVTPRSSGGFGPSAGGAAVLTDKDLTAVEGVRGVEIAMPVLFKSLPTDYKSENAVLTYLGVPLADTSKFFSDVQHFTIAQGRNLRNGEQNSVVIGSNVYANAYGENIRLGTDLELLGQKVRVVGIMEETGNSQYDNAVIISIDTLRSITDAPKDQMSIILVKANEDPNTVAQNIESKLENIHHEKLFTAMTTQQVLKQINQIFGVLSVVLAGIAGISLLVAAFGIMNTMLMSVLERTREIGIMKAIGATNHRVLGMFLIESSLVGFIGGLVGVILGYAMSFGLAASSVSFLGLNLIITPDPVLIGGMLAFATLVGALAGTYPARRASKMDPVEALRYE